VCVWIERFYLLSAPIDLALSHCKQVFLQVKVNGTATVEDMDTGGGEKKPCTTLRKLLTRNQANGNLTSDKQVMFLLESHVHCFYKLSTQCEVD